MRSVQKVTQEEKELKVLIGSLKNVLTDIPYDFIYEDSALDGSGDEDDGNNDDDDDDEYYD